jgi:4-hydroxy-tetrahydrodipicolinate synthase
MVNADWMRGCATALVTPFTAAGAVDERRLRSLIEFQIENGVGLLVPCGTTGESATMTEEEDRRVIALAVETARGRAKIIAGTGSNSTSATIEYSKVARELGADAALIVAPYYNKPTQQGLIAHFTGVAESVPDLPIMIYNVPGRTSSNISAETTLRLARETRNIVAIKEASGNMSQIMAVLRERPSNFRVFSGDDALTLPMMILGADGLVSVASNEAPALMAEMVNAALNGDWHLARELHFRLLPLMEGNFIESSPGPVKAGLALMGLIEENLRLPLVPVEEKSRRYIAQLLTDLGVIGGNA